MARIRATVLGLQDEGADLCAAVCADPRFQLVAVTDREQARADECAARHGAQAYADHRSAVVESKAEALLVASPSHERGEYLKAASELEMAVLTSQPPLIDLEQAVEMSRFFAGKQATLSGMRLWQSEPAYVRLGGAGDVGGQAVLRTRQCHRSAR